MNEDRIEHEDWSKRFSESSLWDSGQFRTTMLNPNKHCVDWGNLGPPKPGDYTVCLQDWQAKIDWALAEKEAAKENKTEPLDCDYFRALARSNYMAGAQQAAAKLYADLSKTTDRLDIVVFC